ncbi:precursor to secretory protein Ssp120 [Gloeophyllum trabeum ATCC 11539]|uniref:Precursor to secretory protein Ssp120 n=1 Tax=Gloeophyllum trabeum (strain ATCC 11539 / FP-39264 / Madison 617) TaxID=670483 RepID=S7RYT0_GLOTA|nr:precursor to secretory protein Ssp120 [Gloeophyllum trabeum ATCC 11539]EPQ60110.1 precursor to secretory protein Ssp120 [Gloeophyllum trabeum ATCC 11539]
MKTLTALSLLFSLQAARGHAGHEGPASGETIQQYAQRHMVTEHHIDSFDLRSFFQLHDLNRDGVWDRDEIEAIYGVHHVYSQKKSKDEVEHQKKADTIANTVLDLLDKNKDGKVTPEEFEAVGLDGLPNFEELGAEGHHYDVESEFFLHHEELYHSTPETQTDESYNHPEDIEHFAQHEQIERAEAEREAKFQGISVEEAIAQHDPDNPDNQIPEVPAPGTPVPPPAPDAAQVPIVEHPHDDQLPKDDGLPKEPDTTVIGKPRATRVTPPEKQAPEIRYKDAKLQGESQAEWGAGAEGYKSPKSPADRMRKNLPYKNRMQYKFRRSWGDF